MSYLQRGHALNESCMEDAFNQETKQMIQENPCMCIFKFNEGCGRRFVIGLPFGLQYSPFKGIPLFLGLGIDEQYQTCNFNCLIFVDLLSPLILMHLFFSSFKFFFLIKKDCVIDQSSAVCWIYLMSLYQVLVVKSIWVI